jgi:hypothetical protein
MLLPSCMIRLIMEKHACGDIQSGKYSIYLDDCAVMMDA